MSFILDALKKSEAERQRQNTPGIASIPERGRHSGRSRWTWLVVGLLLINLAVLAALVWRQDSAEEPVRQAALPVAAPPATPPESFAEIVSEAKRKMPEVPVADSQAATPAPIEPAATASPDPAPVARVQSSQPAGTILPTFDELRARGMLQLPDMHVDIHVYSGEPADRFVFVNMSKYKENARLTEGPVITEITADGVVMDYLGTTFLLPRE